MLWSRALTIAHQPHEDVLGLLFKAPAACPFSPIDYNNRSLLNWLQQHAQPTLNQDDVLAWHPSENLGYTEVLPPCRCPSFVVFDSVSANVCNVKLKVT